MLAASVAMAGCSKTGTGGTNASGRHPWTEPGVLRWTEFADPKNLNPLLNSASPTLDISMFVFSWTVRYDQNAKPYADAVSEIPTVEVARRTARDLQRFEVHVASRHEPAQQRRHDRRI
jgi:ABC-type transport system substrate-binding protein